MIRKVITSLFLFFVIGEKINSQAQRQPKKLNVKGVYIHSPTKMEFPERIGMLQRHGIYAFDKRKENIGSTYKNSDITLSIYVYPAGNGHEGRLRNHYFQVLQDISYVSKNKLSFEQQYKYFYKDGFKINGYSAITSSKPKSQLTLFECGEWFFKIRTTSNSNDTSQINIIEKSVLNSFDITSLVKSSRLNSKARINFAKSAFRDSLMLGSIMGSAFKKVSWAIENTDSLERLSGFPDIYLELHVESLKELVQFQKGKNWAKEQSTTAYLNELNNIIESGFLEEFIMEQFYMIMSVPHEVIFDFKGFNKWKETNPITIDLNRLFYIISYESER